MHAAGIFLRFFLLFILFLIWFDCEVIDTNSTKESYAVSNSTHSSLLGCVFLDQNLIKRTFLTSFYLNVTFRIIYSSRGVITHSNSTKQLAKRRCYNHFVLVEVLLSRLNALQHGFPVSIQTYTKKDGTMCNAYMHISQANNVRFFAFSLWNNNVKNSSKSSFYLLDFFSEKNLLSIVYYFSNTFHLYFVAYHVVYMEYAILVDKLLAKHSLFIYNPQSECR